MEIIISDIKIGHRVRREMGDLAGLAQSISDGELLQPIGVTPEHELVFGLRRLLAFRDVLKRGTIPARIVDVQSVLLGQIEENILRKDFTISERVAIVDSLRSFKHGGDRRSDQARNSRLDLLADACKRVGVSEDTYRGTKVVEEKGVPELVEAMDSGKLSIHAAETLAKASAEEQKECLTKRIDTARSIKKALARIRNRKQREDALVRAVEAPKRDDDIQIHHCRFQELEKVARIEPNSVQLICTDFPYGQEFLDQLVELGQFAERVLVEGGLLVTLSGQFWLPMIFDAFKRSLTWRWMNSTVWSGDANVVHIGGWKEPHARVLNNWKPTLVFSKGGFPLRGQWHDVSFVSTKEKDWHLWQQPLVEVEKLVRDFSEPGDLVVDPCGGGFTTAIACLKHHRRFIGCDIDKAAVVMGQERLALERRHEALPGDCRIVETTDDIQIWCGDCLSLMRDRIAPESVDVTVTSIPYNVGADYASYDDKRPEPEYLAWLDEVFAAVKSVLKDDGSFFLNVGSTRRKPWNAKQVSEVARRHFELQNEIAWVKSITVDGRSHGHFTPLNGDRYLNQVWEPVLHLTKTGTVKLDRLAVGVPYEDKANLRRNQAEGDLRCGGDVWFIPHETTQDRGDKDFHPCVFPVGLPERCIRLHGIRSNMLVLDPFNGVGSSTVAAARLGVRGIGIDLDPGYCQAAQQKLQNPAVVTGIPIDWVPVASSIPRAG